MERRAVAAFSTGGAARPSRVPPERSVLSSRRRVWLRRRPGGLEEDVRRRRFREAPRFFRRERRGGLNAGGDTRGRRPRRVFRPPRRRRVLQPPRRQGPTDGRPVAGVPRGRAGVGPGRRNVLSRAARVSRRSRRRRGAAATRLPGNVHVDAAAPPRLVSPGTSTSWPRYRRNSSPRTIHAAAAAVPRLSAEYRFYDVDRPSHRRRRDVRAGRRTTPPFGVDAFPDVWARGVLEEVETLSANVVAHLGPTPSCGEWRAPSGRAPIASGFHPGGLGTRNGHHVDHGPWGDAWDFALADQLAAPWCVVVVLLTDAYADGGPTLCWPGSHHVMARLLARLGPFHRLFDTPAMYVRRAELPKASRGDAAAATWIFRGDESRRRRGGDVDILWRRVAATPRRGRGHFRGGEHHAAGTRCSAAPTGIGAIETRCPSSGPRATPFSSTLYCSTRRRRRRVPNRAPFSTYRSRCDNGAMANAARCLRSTRRSETRSATRLRSRPASSRLSSPGRSRGDDCTGAAGARLFSRGSRTGRWPWALRSSAYWRATAAPLLGRSRRARRGFRARGSGAVDAFARRRPRPTRRPGATATIRSRFSVADRLRCL